MMSTLTSLTDEELTEIKDYIKQLYGTDIKIDFSLGDIYIDNNGDIKLTGAVANETLIEIEDFLKQNIIIALNEPININGQYIELTDFLGFVLDDEILFIILQTLITEKLMSLDYIRSISEISFRREFDKIYITIEVQTVTFDEIKTMIVINNDNNG